jgi:hypothetical protein
MATNAPVAPLQGTSLAPFERAPSQEPTWRQFLAHEDAAAFWKSLAALIESIGDCPSEESDQLTQSVFLELMTYGWIERFLEEDWTDASISAHLLSRAAIHRGGSTEPGTD